MTRGNEYSSHNRLSTQWFQPTNGIGRYHKLFLFTVTKILLLEKRHLLHQEVVRQEVVRRQNRLNAGHFYRQLGSGVSSSSVAKD